MNSTITFDDPKLFDAAMTVLALEETPSYSGNIDTLTIESDDILEIEKLLQVNDITQFYVEVADENDRRDDEGDQFRHDGEADGDALASAGFGTDEDYGSASEHFSDDE